MSKVAYFPGLLPDSIDISAYVQPVERVAIRPASFFAERTMRVLSGDTSSAGLPLPWSKAHDVFAFRPGELTIWTGYKAHGKSLMLSQILLGALCCGERVLIISPEFRPEAVLARKIRQAAQCPNPADEFVQRFLAWAGDQRLWLFDHQGSLSPSTVLGIVRYAVDQHAVTHVLIDSLMKCGIATDDYNAQKQFVDELQSIAHQSGPHIHLVAHARKGQDDHAPPKLHDVKGTSELCDMAENVLTVWKNKRKLSEAAQGIGKRIDEPDGLLTIDSQRNGDGWTGSIALWFSPASFQFIGGPNHPLFDYAF